MISGGGNVLESGKEGAGEIDFSAQQSGRQSRNVNRRVPQQGKKAAAK